MDQTHHRHADTPQDHNARDEDAGPQPLQQDIRQRLGERVRDEKDRESGIVLAPSDVQGTLQVVQSGISDVGPVEEADEVEQAEPWDEAKVELP